MRTALLVPAEFLTVRLPERTFVGMRKLMRVFAQVVKAEAGIAIEPIRTVLLPREEPKLLPLTVTV